MKLFDLFGKKSRGNQSEKSEEEVSTASTANTEIYSGMRTEVTDFDGHVLFAATLENQQKDTAQLHQYSESTLSPESGPVRVRIRGYNDSEKKAVYMEGVITLKSERIWQVDELVVTKIGNDRAFFRLDTDLDAKITTFGGYLNEGNDCKLLNISVGGARISSKDKYEKGDKFLLKVKLLEDRPEAIMLCQVLRVIKKEGSFEYGCQFLGLTEEDQDEITQSIFVAQRQRRRGF